MNTHTTQTLDTLGHKLGEAALTLLVRLYPEVRQASDAQLEAACAAMRAQVGPVLDELLTDAREAPTVAHLAFQTAALTLAHGAFRRSRQAANKSAKPSTKRLASPHHSANMQSPSPLHRRPA